MHDSQVAWLQFISCLRKDNARLCRELWQGKFSFESAVVQVFVNILRTSTIVARADASIQRYPGVAAAPLVLGTLGGCGGKFLQDALYISSGRSPGA